MNEGIVLAEKIEEAKYVFQNDKGHLLCIPYL